METNKLQDLQCESTCGPRRANGVVPVGNLTGSRPRKSQFQLQS